ncbi:hypothetical protein OC842_004786 [Tilletia horrida]|uniref:Uncharacterized protein n=1 Tax=Tilletia horrida TaxID=155126 RepID=A0AAN6GAE3_9BASI|nr:hypothetical protein OC842_004786 [Tilletia horrida]
MSGTKTTKWCTFLALCADAILTYKTSRGHLHTFGADVFDSTGRPFELDINQWARTKPEDGLYMLTNVPFATSLPPTRRIAEIDEPNSSRAVPSEIDGTDPDMPSIRQTDASYNGIGVTFWRSMDKKSCKIKGYTYINRDLGWVPWETFLSFPPTTRYENWTCHDVGSLVAFDAIIGEQENDQPLKGVIRRLAYIADAPRNLQHALGVGGGGSDAQDRRAKLRYLHEKRARDNSSAASSSGDSSASLTDNTEKTSEPSTPTKTATEDHDDCVRGDAVFATPVQSDKGKAKAVDIEAPSPSAPRTSKRHRQD